MDQVNSNAAVVDQAARKANKQKFGAMGGPIAGAVRVLKKDQAHDFGGKAGVSWVIVTSDGRLIKATTYSGNLGDRFNLGDHNTQPVPTAGSKDERRALKGYSEVPLAECPIVAVPAATTPTTPPEGDQSEQGDAGTGDDETQG